MRNRFITHTNAKLPERSTKYSAGYDIFAPEDIKIPAHSVSRVYDTEVSVQLKHNLFLAVYIRSSLAIKHQITLTNNTGIIDSDFFPKTIKLQFRNDSNKPYFIKKGDKIAQGIITKYYKAKESKPKHARTSGIGSTGK